jgi:hypothetical protein
MRSIHSDTPKKVIIARVFTEKQMDQFYDLAVKYRNNSMSREELILELRGGEIQNWVAAFGIVIAIITVLNNVEGFQVPPGAIVPPHFQWLYENQQPRNHFGYGKGAGTRSLTVTGATNSGFERNYIETAYSQIPNLSVEGTNEQVTAWSVAKHAHHGPDFGMNPSNYGMSQSELPKMASLIISIKGERHPLLNILRICKCLGNCLQNTRT